MKNFEEKQLKKIERQIWWIETKVGWLRFVSGKIAGYNSIGSSPLLLYLPIAGFIFAVYVILDKFLISKLLIKKQLIVFFWIVLFLVFCFLGRILEKRTLSYINFLEQRLNFLYKKKSNLTEIINHKS